MRTIDKLALSNDKNNKTRSILIMAAVFLTTMLLTIICIFANGILKTNRLNAATNYGSYYGIFSAITKDELTEVERRSEFTEIGVAVSAGIIKSDNDVFLQSMDQEALKLTNLSSSLEYGSFPKEENEIAAQADFFESMGYHKVKAGDRVVLPYRKDKTETYEDKTFIVSGIIHASESESQTSSYLVYCSDKFYESVYEEDEIRYSVYFRLDSAVSMNTDNAEDVIKALAGTCGIDEKQVALNNYYLMWVLDPGFETIGFCGLIALFVILFSVVVIYNIFQVGIVQKVQEYGKIKALGATRKQMKKLIYKEGMYLTIPSIPVGILAGFLIACACFNWLYAQTNAMNSGAELQHASLFSLPMILLSALLAFFTVFLALRKPMKVVMNISSVEAIRYSEGMHSKNAGQRKGKRKVSVFSLAMANITGNKRRTFSTIVTMGLSCVLFVVIANCVGNIDSEYDARQSINHGQFQIALDYELDDEAYPENNLDSILKENPLNQELLSKIKDLLGVTDVQTRTILSVEVNGEKDAVSVLSEEDYNQIKKDGYVKGNVDYKDAKEAGSFYYAWGAFMEDYGFSLNQPLTLQLENGTASYHIDGTLKGAFGSADTSWIMTQDAYNKMGIEDDSIGYIWVDCEKEDIEGVQSELEDLLSETKHIEISTFQNALETSEFATRIMKLGSYLFLGILGLIGFMNLLNTMIISIITKRQEYGIMQAVGMTNRQFSRSLQLQGLIFTVGTVVISLVIGLPAGYGIFVHEKAKGFFGLNVYHIPMLEIGVMVVLITMLQLGLSIILSRNLKKESLVDRIRYQG